MIRGFGNGNGGRLRSLGGLGRLDGGFGAIRVGLDLDKAHEEVPSSLENGSQHVSETDPEGHFELKLDLLGEKIRLDSYIGVFEPVNVGDPAEKLHEILNRLIHSPVDHRRLHGIGGTDTYVKHSDLDVKLTEETGEKQLQNPADQGDQICQSRPSGLLFFLECLALLLGKLGQFGLLFCFFLFLFCLLQLFVLCLFGLFLCGLGLALAAFLQRITLELVSFGLFGENFDRDSQYPYGQRHVVHHFNGDIRMNREQEYEEQDDTTDHNGRDHRVSSSSVVEGAVSGEDSSVSVESMES